MSLPALLFDLDGTITDPKLGYLASMNHAFETLGVKAPSDAELLTYIGPPLRETMGKTLSTNDPERIEEAVALYRWRLENGGKFEAEVFPHLRETLAHFDQKGYDIYVCTGKPECVATDIIQHFSLECHFKGIYGAKLDGRHCDKADLIAHIWDVEAIPPSAGIMIGDTLFDMHAAKQNGLKTVAVSWGFGQNQDLLQFEPTQFVDQPSELVSAIEACC